MKKIIACLLSVLFCLSSSIVAFAMPGDVYGHWAEDTLKKWYTWGYITGYPDGLLHPNGQITRAEFVTLTNYALGYHDTTNISFVDVPSTFWGHYQIASGVAAGYISGDRNGYFRPYDPVTRQEAAVMVYNIRGLSSNPTYAVNSYLDAYQMPAWSRGAIGAVTAAGYMSGYEGNIFRPTAALSRAEAVVLLDKLAVQNTGGMTGGNTGTSLDIPVPTPVPSTGNSSSSNMDWADQTLTTTSMQKELVEGDLTISSSLGSKTVTLQSVTVEGSLIVEGGSKIILKDCEIAHMIIDKKDVTIDCSDSIVEYADIATIATLEGDEYGTVTITTSTSGTIEIDAIIETFVMDGDTDVDLMSNADIAELEATKYSDGAELSFSNASVSRMNLYGEIEITGKGTINTMTVYVDGIESTIEPKNLYTKDDAEKPTFSEPEVDVDDLSNLTASSAKSYSGDYKTVTVTKSGATLKNMTVYQNLNIDDDVADGDVTLNNVTVKGYTNIEGGGSNSISFTKCKLQNDITVEKSKGEIPALQFDSNTLSSFSSTLVIEGNGAILKGEGTINNVKINTDKAVTINIPVKTLTVTKDNSNITITQKVDTVVSNNTVNIKTEGTNASVGVTNGSSITVNGSVQASALSLSATSLGLAIGEQATQLIATTNPAGQTVTWSSSNTAVATVNNGFVTPVSVGTATIIAKTANATATCTVTVTQPLTSISIGCDTQTAVNNTYTIDSSGSGSTLQLKAILNPVDTSQKTLKWESGNTDILTVDKNGLVTVEDILTTSTTVQITATSTHNPNISASCYVTVHIVPTSIDIKEAKTTETNYTILNDTVNIPVNTKDVQFIAELNPSGAEQDVIWTLSSFNSKDESLSLTEDGILSTGNTSQTITITAKSQRYQTVTKTITVIITDGAS